MKLPACCQDTTISCPITLLLVFLPIAERAAMSRRSRTALLACLVLGLLPLLGGCGGGVIGDVLPHAIGGYPKDAPPRAGAPGYDEWLQKVYGTKPKEPGEKAAEQSAK